MFDKLDTSVYYALDHLSDRELISLYNYIVDEHPKFFSNPSSLEKYFIRSNTYISVRGIVFSTRTERWFFTSSILEMNTKRIRPLDSSLFTTCRKYNFNNCSFSII